MTHANFPGPLAIAALGALALWWLYRRGLRAGSRRLTAPPLAAEPGEQDLVTIHPGILSMPPIVLH